MKALVFQTADAFRYQPILQATSRTVIDFFRRSSCAYESFVGIKRGFWPWQSTFNRIIMFDDLVRRGFDGWAIYLDADAYIQDLDFLIKEYLASKSHHAAIMASACATPHRWDVNAGVCFINTAHPLGIKLVDSWLAAFNEVSDAQLHDASEWMEAKNDQDLLQIILRTDAAIMDAVLIESTDLINSNHATFIRQHLRQYTPDFDARVGLVEAATDKILDASPVGSHPQDALPAVYATPLSQRIDVRGNATAVADLNTPEFRSGLKRWTSNILAEIKNQYLRI